MDPKKDHLPLRPDCQPSQPFFSAAQWNSKHSSQTYNIQVLIFYCDQCDTQRVRQHELLPKALWSSAMHMIFAECNITTAQFYLWASKIPTPTETLLLNIDVFSSIQSLLPSFSCNNGLNLLYSKLHQPSSLSESNCPIPLYFPE